MRRERCGERAQLPHHSSHIPGVPQPGSCVRPVPLGFFGGFITLLVIGGGFNLQDLSPPPKWVEAWESQGWFSRQLAPLLNEDLTSLINITRDPFAALTTGAIPRDLGALCQKWV